MNFSYHQSHLLPTRGIFIWCLLTGIVIATGDMKIGFLSNDIIPIKPLLKKFQRLSTRSKLNSTGNHHTASNKCNFQSPPALLLVAYILLGPDWTAVLCENDLLCSVFPHTIPVSQMFI